ncbi:MAG TPA: BamA/TamA family outer membrane protein, partial [Chitinophagaceae bacterium]|nr:BamA/TamA family outer membrane protein [Chitinophagaceae bacterium]
DGVEKLIEDNSNTVDQQAVLRARILDMFVMDFDRHEGQWEWGAIDHGNGKQFYPIPKDRDQAFYTNEGVIPHIVQWPWLVPQLEGLKPKTKNIKRFNFAARNFDRFFLNQLTEQDWENITSVFLSMMVDTVIENALKEQPAEIRDISGPKIVNTLKERRKYLAADVMEYYRFLAEIVDITASDKDELINVARHDDGSVNLLISDMRTNDTIFHRKFDAQDTKEIRIYGFGGRDRFVVGGNNDKIKIRMIGGKGEDHFENNASSEGAIVYDDQDGNNSFSGKFKQKLRHDSIANHYDPLYYQYNKVIPFVSVGYNPDDGVFLGGWMKIVHHGFRKTPYKNSHSITLNHALATRAFNIRYNAEFISVIGNKTDLLIEADVKSPHVPNFFGYGPSTEYDKSKPGKFRYYRTRYNLGDFAIELRRNFSEKVFMTIGPSFQFFKMDSSESYNRKRFIGQEIPPGLDPTRAFSKQLYAGGRFTLTADTRDNKSLTGKGVFWQSSVRHFSGLNAASYDVTQVNSDFSFYLPLIKKVLVFANRIGGGHNFGDFEIHQAQYLGNDDHLRGYRKYRFAGKSKFYNNMELRWRISSFKTYLFPGSIGVHAFFDTGRVWADNDSSD